MTQTSFSKQPRKQSKPVKNPIDSMRQWLWGHASQYPNTTQAIQAAADKFGFTPERFTTQERRIVFTILFKAVRSR